MPRCLFDRIVLIDAAPQCLVLCDATAVQLIIGSTFVALRPRGVVNSNGLVAVLFHCEGRHQTKLPSTTRTGDDPTWLPALAAICLKRIRHQRMACTMAECLSSSRPATILGTIAPHALAIQDFACPRLCRRLCGHCPPPCQRHERRLDDDIVRVCPRLRAIRLCPEHHLTRLGARVPRQPAPGCPSRQMSRKLRRGPELCPFLWQGMFARHPANARNHWIA